MRLALRGSDRVELIGVVVVVVVVVVVIVESDWPGSDQTKTNLSRASVQFS